MMIRLIVAMDSRHGIGKKGFQPWYIPTDEKFFTEHTKLYGGHVLVGSTTFRTFKGPLIDRHNYVLTRDETPITGTILVHDLTKFMEDFRNRDLWVIGGAQVFAQVMDADLADELYITHIAADFGCDQFFPAYDAFHKVEDSGPQQENGFSFNFVRYGTRK